MNIHLLLRRVLLALTLAAIVCATPSCKPKASTGSSRLTAKLAGREIIAVIDGGAAIFPKDTWAEIAFTDHKIAVEKERLLLDGAELAKLPAAAAKVEVTVAGGKLTVTADGAAVATKELGK